MLGLATLGTGIEPPAAEDTARSRKCRIDREPVGSAAAFADHLRVVWLTPAMDQLFIGPGLGAAALSRPAGAGGRCRAHQPRLRAGACAALAQPAAGGAAARSALARCGRARNRGACGRGRGLRAETVRRLQGALATRQDDAFPSAEIALDGWMERLLPDHPGGRDRGPLPRRAAGQPRRDAAAGRTLDGPHLTDLCVVYPPKNIPAADASTGEQKALLIGLVLAHAGLLAEMTGFAPVLLLDEVVAHLDPGAPRRALRRARAARRAGLDDRRRSRGLRRHRGRAEVFTVSAGRRAAPAGRTGSGSLDYKVPTQ